MPVAHCLAFYEYRIGRFKGSWPMGLTRYRKLADSYRRLLQQ